MTMILAATLSLAMLKDDDITMVNNDKDNEIDYGYNYGDIFFYLGNPQGH